MYRIDDATAATSLPAPEAAGAEGFFTEGNPATGTPATNVRGSWLNMIQEELRAVVVARGLDQRDRLGQQARCGWCSVCRALSREKNPYGKRNRQEHKRGHDVRAVLVVVAAERISQRDKNEKQREGDELHACISTCDARNAFSRAFCSALSRASAMAVCASTSARTIDTGSSTVASPGSVAP